MVCAKKIFSVLIAGILIALCAIVPALAADTPSGAIPLNMTNPYVWWGFYVSENSGLTVSDYRENENINIGLNNFGPPWFRISYSKKFPDNFVWNSDYSYLITFTCTVGFQFSDDNPPSAVPAFPFFNGQSVDIGMFNKRWENYVPEGVEPFINLSTEASSFSYDYDSEGYRYGDNRGRIETHSYLFTIDSNSVLYGNEQNYRYIDIYAKKNISGFNQNTQLRFERWSITAFYDPAGNIDINDSTVQDIVQGQQAAVDYGLQAELSANEDALQGAESAASDAQQVFDNTDFLTGVTQIYNSVTYNGYDFSFKLPSSGDVPYVGELWDEQEIPLKSYIDDLPVVVRTLLKFLLWIGALGIFVFVFHTALSIINNGTRKR